MEFWLMQDTEKLQLPVPPPNYSIKRALDNTVIKVEGIGEVSFIGKSKLAEIPPIKTFFPNQIYTFCEYSDFPTPKECTDLIEKWRLSGKPIRYLVTDAINIECTIESFEHGEQDGTGDVYFSLELKEYRRIILEVVSPSISVTTKATKATTATKATVAQRPTKTVAKKYTVKAGDTLSAIAKKQYGDSSKYTLIASKNKLKNPNLIKVGQVLIL
ncbi:LysM peptidoglycan-binding domain-containing protein [Clostridium tagluense]|uniref:LysM peptidoglycan-binding domain-containing protein n=1 Tax=Clostridium tagluense TaxID=360422 RepID=UPI001C6ED829|nr:LysM peptidoglycan-binding domain-containing protein [Clostridium tagluense]MBW9158869.1 LysM peptidoglycan-binding domain-containing protein [Clostridium tagluense]WLC67153.1 LysM peptidoglycan-binding domain-containing protein [Clostridium tagluense]